MSSTLLARSQRNDARIALADQRLHRELSYINGHWVAGGDGQGFSVSNPSNGEDIAWVTSLSASETTEAIDAASAALAGWKTLLPQARARILQQWHDLILEAKDDLAMLMTLEQGKPLCESKGEIEYAASFITYYAQEALRMNVESVTSHLPNAHMQVVRTPVGVAGLVTPWNFPSAMLTRKAAAALAAGCTIVAHPSSETPLSALALAELGERAGLPAGVFNIITGDAATIVGTMCADARVRAMSFTGSTEVGRLIAKQSAPTVKRLIMELGGHAPLIVFDDADIEQAVKIAIDAKFATSGQDCLAANRIFVQKPIYERFCKAYAEKISELKVGDGLEADVEIGPLMHSRAVAKVDEQVKDAAAKGAKVLTGGNIHKAGPLFYQPTLLVDVPENALIMREETFGPVAAVTSFDTEEEVIARANDSEYGLVAYVVTRDGARQHRMAAELEYGMVAINRVKITGAPIPFGGVKQSGLGREGSRHGLEAFTDLKYLCFNTNN